LRRKLSTANPLARIFVECRQELALHMRNALTPVYDFRKPADKIRDRIADRVELARAA
jgi:hypothetical protein